MAVEKFVFLFDETKKGNTLEAQFLLGNKGAQLSEMINIGLPVPPGFTITTKACKEFYSKNRQWPKGLEEQIKAKLSALEKRMGKKLGDSKNPLFVSVRSGSYVSMPGMMDTVLNLGMNDESVKAFAQQTKNERVAWDSYRRFIHMFGDVVMNVSHEKFEECIHKFKETKGKDLDTELSATDLKELVEKYKDIVKNEKGKLFPQNSWEQLKMAIDAVFNSWNSSRAIAYRRINSLRNDAGTAVNVQSMVFGNMGNDSGTGVSFTRNPGNGKKEHYGEFLANAQGEDVVAGIRTPSQVDEMKKTHPKVYAELLKVYEKLEKHYKDLQDFEFTFEKGKLYLLQTRSGKRTAQAAVKIAVDMVKEKLITKEEAVLRVKPEQLDHLLHKQLDSIAKQKSEVIAKGIAASPGAAVGKAVFKAEKAKELFEKDPTEKLILVRTETTPEDIEGMNVAKGILTARGGATCLSGDTIILTKHGFMKMKEAFEQIENGEKPSILSFNSKTMKTEWKKVIATGRRTAKTIKVKVSQSGRTENSFLRITPDHKMLTFDNRKLIKKPLSELLEQKEFGCLVNKMPAMALQYPSIYNQKQAYVMGALATDGYAQCDNRHGRVVFTQKNIPEKQEFIQEVMDDFEFVFGEKFSSSREKFACSIINDRIVSGTATDFCCYRKGAAQMVLMLKQSLAQSAMSWDEQSLLHFLAGAVDGDGCFSNNRINIFSGKKNVTEAVVVSCLRLGIIPQISVNRTIFNIQIMDGAEKILQHTKRVKGNHREKIYESKLFSIKQLFSDIKDEVNYMGRTKEAIKRNLLFGKNKIERDILPLCTGETKNELQQILDSDLRMTRIEKVEDFGEELVYNFEVDSENELDKNYIAFTSTYNPVLVSNSHAAVVARGMGKCCVAGSNDIQVNEKEGYFKTKSSKNEITIKEGDWISLDGTAGEVYLGQIPMVEPELSGEFGELMQWADSFRKLGIRANADIPRDALIARKFGAQGIGLCRTEHMFFEGERIKAMREMILAETEENRRKALAKLLPYQKADFAGLFEAMEGLPVIIRLLDPPLHEFLPQEEKQIQEIAKETGVSAEKIRAKISQLHEINPMLGFRGCRLGIVFPEISEMQVQAIIEAALEVQAKGKKVIPEIMIPVLAHATEMKKMKELTDRIAKQTMEKYGKTVKYMVGVMMELPRACLTADDIANAGAEFFSFGTNDLTQTTLGYSRDDAAKFIPLYVERQMYERDPFQTLDTVGVGQLIKISVEKGKSVDKKLEIGICGEHGGDPASIEFCHKTGLNYVSCSPYRVPIARLAAAQAALKEKKRQ